MGDIAIVIDSAVQVPMDPLPPYVRVVPVHVEVEGKVLKDLEISPEDFVKMVRKNKAFPKTSQPTPSEFRQTYEDLALQGFKKVLSLHISGKMSGTVNSAMLAADEVKNLIEVFVIDTQTGSYGSGLIVERVIEMVEAGENVQDIVLIARELAGKGIGFVLLKDLEFPARSGRVPGIANVISSMFRIRPLIEVSEGKMSFAGVFRGPKKAFSTVASRIQKLFPNADIVITYILEDTDAKKAHEVLKEAFPRARIRVRPSKSVGLLSHMGPGAVGIFAIPVHDR